MAQSPLTGSEGDLRLSILCDGAPLDEVANILSIEVTHAVNRIPSARIVLLDDSDVDATLRHKLSDSARFAPGAAIAIQAGYGLASATIFAGIVVRQGIKVAPFGRSQLIVDCRHEAVRMSVGRRCANYVDQTDSAIMTTLAQDHGLAPEVTATTLTHKELVQYDVGDWDFLLARAEANGYVVTATADAFTVGAPATSGAAQLAVHYGVDLLEFDAEIDARTQLASVVTTAWDPAQQQAIEQAAAPPTLNSQGDLAAAKLAAVAGPDSYHLRAAVPLDSAALQAWSKARQLRAGLARVRGRLRFCGNALASPNTLLTVSGAGSRYDGDTWLSAVTHLIKDGVWTTEAEFGLAPETLAERGELAGPRASGLTAAVSGLQIGVVSKLDEDPAAQYKVQVTLPVTKAETAGVWARLACHYASSGAGHFFIPEVGDEVLLGFLNDDPSHPVILGSLYSSMRKAPYAPAAENNTKAIVTRSQLKIEFDEEKKSITITTPANNKIVLSDDGKSILLQDQTQNVVKLSEDGILLDSPKDIAITAKGKITLDAVGEVGVASQADLKCTGMNVSHTANAGFSAKGAASAELSASGQTVVKGAIVMIN
jgi:Rhs element Vgr protein